MNSNPWNVGSIDEFSYLNCPECTFHSKEKTSFENHATRNHPLSSVLFGKATKVIMFSSVNEITQLKKNVYPSKTITDECQTFKRSKSIPNIEKKTKNQIDFTSKVQTCNKEINNSDLETECNKMDTSISPKMKSTSIGISTIRTDRFGTSTGKTLIR